jgi:hypothetical protein
MLVYQRVYIYMDISYHTFRTIPIIKATQYLWTKKRFPSSPSREAMAQYQPWAICKSTTPMENCWYIGILYIEYNMYNGILYIADILEYNLYNAKWCSASHVMGLRSHAGLVKSKSYTLQPKTCAGTVGVRHDTCLRRCSSLNNLDVIWKNECVHFPHQI